MKNTLIDAGPIIALFSKRDKYHKKAIEFIQQYEGRLYTTWPVIAEASHMLNFSSIAQVNLLKWIYRGGLWMVEMDNEKCHRLIELTEKYDDVSIDLADATLIVSSEFLQSKEIASIDSDFYIYKNIRNQYLTNIFISN